MDSKKIGAFIALKRKQKGLTQAQLGERLGVSNKTVSRWENGNYMPDLSLLQPLSQELDISLNELLSGEKIEKEKAAEYSEKNLTDAIDYSNQKIKNEHLKISVLMISLGIFMSFYAFWASPPESGYGKVFLMLGIGLLAAGIFREFKAASLWKKSLASVGIFFIILGGFMVMDYLKASDLKQPPLFSHMTVKNIDETKVIEYQGLFCNVYQINADTPNEYFLIDHEKTYDLNTVPISPFKRDKSGIQNIIRYQNQYLGNNSNTGNLINALPLSEYGFVFEIDSRNSGVIIDYHATDWYHNENLYIEKGLLYNAVSMFSLIDNLAYIQFNFSGSSYSITRDTIVMNYPDYGKIFTDQHISQEGFNTYVEQKMNDKLFVETGFALFEKK